MVPGGHLSNILVVIIGFRQWGVREGQNMAQNGPLLWLWCPLAIFGSLWLHFLTEGFYLFFSFYPSELSARGATQDFEKNPKCTHLNYNKARRSTLGQAL